MMIQVVPITLIFQPNCPTPSSSGMVVVELDDIARIPAPFSIFIIIDIANISNGIPVAHTSTDRRPLS